jgi:hypothetical protein
VWGKNKAIIHESLCTCCQGTCTRTTQSKTKCSSVCTTSSITSSRCSTSLTSVRPAICFARVATVTASACIYSNTYTDKNVSHNRDHSQSVSDTASLQSQCKQCAYEHTNTPHCTSLQTPFDAVHKYHRRATPVSTLLTPGGL